MNYIGIDLGTSSVKLVLMDTAGNIIALVLSVTDIVMFLWEQAVQYSFQVRNSGWIPTMHFILSVMQTEAII